MAKSTRQKTTNIRASLIKQLESMGKNSPEYIDLVDAYMDMRKTRELLRADISKRGLKIVWKDRDGIDRETSNDSVQKLCTVTKSMTDVLKKLGLDGSVEDDEL